MKHRALFIEPTAGQINIFTQLRLYALREGLRKLATGRWVSAGLSFYAWKINRDWQKGNRQYLRELAAGSLPPGSEGIAACDTAPGFVLADARRPPVPRAAPLARVRSDRGRHAEIRV